ncbi:TetR/AcrR family transcriptional regulator [Nocardioides sp. SOB77]|uniref:TetR/AcrR family transcriptional regulator n=1 Tax=Nocardioides oceani TaxID=3058369 RepID=A0ABT8FIG2_9ACTN|nr:TetR/AcrR family transcriptional regulator [Nocardioides oceani]MDN4174240.1 TetR/AcrR family transcriptional regulator [Nocardioides oceani]
MAVQSGTYRGVSAEDRAAERRERLLEATLAVWADPSEARPTMTRICATAGLTERYFYESFRSLDDALTAVMDRIATEIEEVSLAAGDAAGDDPAARARASVLAFVEYLTADPRKGRVAIIEAGAMPALRARRTQLLRHFAHRSAQEARDIYGVGGWGPREGEIAGLLFIGGMAELVSAWLDGSLEATPEELVDAATAMFLGLHVAG